MPAFDVSCGRCKAVIHTSDEHVGRTIRCRCGASLTIARPPAADDSRQSSSRRHNGDDVGAKQGRGRAHSGRKRERRSVRSVFAGVVGRPARELRDVRGLPRWAARLQLAYLVAVVVAACALHLLSERFLPATMLAYGPRMAALVPALLLVPLGALFARGSLVFTLAGVAVALGPVMGLRLGSGPAEVPQLGQVYDRSRVRVVTLNARGGDLLAERVPFFLASVESDVLLIQECGPALARALRQLTELWVDTRAGLCTVSRWPLGQVDSMPTAELRDIAQLGYGGTGDALRYRVAHPVQPFMLVNLHLETARRGLGALLGSDGLLPDSLKLPSALPFTEGFDRVEVNRIIRERESAQASAWATASTAGESVLPLVIAGDFNLPVESTIYRRHWGRFVNAFDEAGRGFGHTKLEGRLLRIRVDHVLLTPGTGRVAGAWVGSDVGSDHRPVIADIELRGGASASGGIAALGATLIPPSRTLSQAPPHRAFPFPSWRP